MAMLQRRLNGHDMPYLQLGTGEPLVCLHGSLCDFRIWSPIMGLLSEQHRLIVPSLRFFFPARWDGQGGGFTIAQHVEDVIGFITALGEPVHLLGHSRGGHIAFRVAQQRPDLLRSLILAEPGGSVDASLAADAVSSPSGAPSYTITAASMVADGDVEGAMQHFIDAIDGPGSWHSLSEPARQEIRDNAFTVLGQRNEGRLPYTRDDAQGLMVRCLLIGGDSTPGVLPLILRAFAEHIPNAQTEILFGTRHFMFRQAPAAFASSVTRFLSQHHR